MFQNKKLKQENERLKKQVEYDKTHICTPQIIELNYISIRKIKDKIEEINKKILNAPKYDEKISVYRYQKQILQELIKESEEN